MAVCWIETVIAVLPVLMDNVLILAKELLIVEIMLFARLLHIGLCVFVLKDMKDLQLVKVVSKLVAKLMGIVLQTNGVTKANVKILVLISELVVRAHSVQYQITMHCVLVLLAWLEIQELNVYEMLTSAYQTHVVLMPDVLIWLELINVNVTLDVRATPRQVALVLRPRLTDANLNSVDLMPSAYPKTELEDASASLDTLMETLRPVVHLDLETNNVNLTSNAPLTNPVSVANVKIPVP